MGRELRRLLNDGLLSGELFDQQWFLYKDAQGVSYCQPDYFIVRDDLVLLVECKLSQTDEAFQQMASLYVPVLRYRYERPIVTVLACKYLRFDPIAPISDLWEAWEHPRQGNLTWHYIGT